MPDDQHQPPHEAMAVLHAPDREPHPPVEDCTIVIFGAFGDLTKRLVMPALYNLARTKVLPENFAIVGVDVVDGSAASWAEHLHQMLLGFVGNANSEFNIDAVDEAVWGHLAERMAYIKGDITKPDVYKAIATELETAASKFNTGGNAIFYLAVGDRFFGDVVDQLGAAGLADQQADADGVPKHWRRVVIEKPFGHDLASAVALNARILRSLHEDQIFRIDHFLGKETVQAIMAFRFANGMFEPIWNRDRIDSVQITAAEVVGVEQRGKFYEPTGALRDMIPNHLFTLMAMVAMEPPVSFDAKGIRDRKAELFTSMPPLKPEDAVRGQYTAGEVKGQQSQDYRKEPNVSPESITETYVAMRVGIDSWRWAGVPFYLRTGKHMTDRLTEIAIRFKPAPMAQFQGTDIEELSANWLVVRIQPQEGISLQFEVKRPGPDVEVSTVSMDFAYKDFFKHEPNVGYETLIYDVMIGDATLFNRADMVEDAWRVVQPILDSWKTGEPAFYPSGAAGPKEADELLAREGRHWRPVEAFVKK